MSDKLQDITDSPFASESPSAGHERERERVRDRERRHAPHEVEAPDEPQAGSAFRAAVARVERHRQNVRTTLGIAMLARLLCEFRLDQLGRSPQLLLSAAPTIGLALLSYMIVLWFLAARTRDRFGFGMALGIGILEATYALGAAAMTHPFSIPATWPMLVVGIAHIPMALTAFAASSAFPPSDSKKPWIVGFVAALVFLAVPWIAPAVMEIAGRVK